MKSSNALVCCTFVALTICSPLVQESTADQLSSHYGLPDNHANSQWTGWGGNILNNRWAEGNNKVKTSTVQSLREHCHIPFEGGVSVSPAIHNNVAYFVTWNALLVAYDYLACQVKWETNITTITYSFEAPDAIQAAVDYPG